MEEAKPVEMSEMAVTIPELSIAYEALRDTREYWINKLADRFEIEIPVENKLSSRQLERVYLLCVNQSEEEWEIEYLSDILSAIRAILAQPSFVESQKLSKEHTEIVYKLVDLFYILCITNGKINLLNIAEEFHEFDNIEDDIDHLSSVTEAYLIEVLEDPKITLDEITKNLDILFNNFSGLLPDSIRYTIDEDTSPSNDKLFCDKWDLYSNCGIDMRLNFDSKVLFKHFIIYRRLLSHSEDASLTNRLIDFQPQDDEMLEHIKENLQEIFTLNDFILALRVFKDDCEGFEINLEDEDDDIYEKLNEYFDEDRERESSDVWKIDEDDYDSFEYDKKLYTMLKEKDFFKQVLVNVPNLLIFMLNHEFDDLKMLYKKDRQAFIRVLRKNIELLPHVLKKMPYQMLYIYQNDRKRFDRLILKLAKVSSIKKVLFKFLDRFNDLESDDIEFSIKDRLRFIDHLRKVLDVKEVIGKDKLILDLNDRYDELEHEIHKKSTKKTSSR